MSPGALSLSRSLGQSALANRFEHDERMSATEAYGAGYCCDDGDGLGERVSIHLKDVPWSWLFVLSWQHYENESLPAKDILVTRGSVNDT